MAEDGRVLGHVAPRSRAMKKGEYKRALNDFDAVTYQCAPGSTSWQNFVHYRGYCNVQTGDLDRAITDFTVAIQRRPDDATVYGCRAAAYWEKRDLDHALSDFDQLVRLSPDQPVVYLIRLEARIAKGDDKGAMADMDRIVQLLPRAAGPCTYRAVLALSLLHDRDGALADLDRALAIDPRASLCYVLRSYLRATMARYSGVHRPDAGRPDSQSAPCEDVVHRHRPTATGAAVRK